MWCSKALVQQFSTFILVQRHQKLFQLLTDQEFTACVKYTNIAEDFLQSRSHLLMTQNVSKLSFNHLIPFSFNMTLILRLHHQLDM